MIEMGSGQRELQAELGAGLSEALGVAEVVAELVSGPGSEASREAGARRRWCDHCHKAGSHYTADHPSSPLHFDIQMEAPIRLRPQDVPAGPWRDMVQRR